MNQMTAYHHISMELCDYADREPDLIKKAAYFELAFRAEETAIFKCEHQNNKMEPTYTILQKSSGAIYHNLEQVLEKINDDNNN